MIEPHYRVCTRCVMDTTVPGIAFDEEGVCSQCRAAERRLQTGWFPGSRGLEMLEDISRTIREYGKSHEYDSIIGLSGGVDSSYALHVAKTIMRLRPLAVHVDAGWNSEIAVKNIESLLTALDVDLFTYVVDWEEVKDLQLAFLRASVANQDIPQDHAFSAKLYEFAIANRIRYVVTGSNLTSESIMPWMYDAKDRRQLIAIHRQFGERPLKTFPTMSFFQFYIYWAFVRRMKRISPLNYLNYNRADAINELEKTYGWRYYGGKHYESNWTRFFQSYYLPVKFGYDKRRPHFSSLILAGQMTRDEAMADLAEPPYDPREIHHEKAYVARKLGISPQELDSLIALPNKSYRDYPNNERWLTILRGVRYRLMSAVG